MNYAAEWWVSAWIVALLAASPALGSEQPVAIVGLGCGGAATAHYFRKAYPDIEIHGFEKDVIGGRAQEIIAGDKMMELGASIIYGRNMYLKNLTLEMNLTVQKVSDSHLDTKFAVYNGKDFAFQATGWSLVDMFLMLKRYGPAPLVFSRYVKSIFASFFDIYRQQESGRAFNTPAEMLASLGLMELPQMNAVQVLQHVLGGKWWMGSSAVQRFIDELPGTANRVNYNQHNEHMSGFASVVSFLPATDGDLWRVKEGNNALPRRLVAQAGVKVHSPMEVSAVRRDQDGQFYLTVGSTPKTGPGGAAQELGPYASVVIAAPLETTNIAFHNISTPTLPPRKFQTTVATFVKGRLRAKYFGKKHLPLLDLSVTNSADTPFTAISPQEVRPDGEVVYKMFSTDTLDNKTLSELFEPYVVLKAHSWKAYPQFSPPEQFSPFVLAPGLFYNNAIENVASALEMSMIAGVNSALLVQQHLESVSDTMLEEVMV